MSDYQAEINKFGFAIVPQLIDEKQIVRLINHLSELGKFSSSRKNGTAYGIRNLFNLSSEVRALAKSRKVKDLVEKVLGEN